MAELDPNKRRTQPDVSANGVPTTDENYMLPSQAAPQPARRGIYPDNGPVGTMATAASVPAAGAAGVYAARIPAGAIAMGAKDALGTLGKVARTVVGPYQAALGIGGATGLRETDEGLLKSAARAGLGIASMLPNPVARIVGATGSGALTAMDETGLPASIFNPWDFSPSKIASIRNWMGGKGPQSLTQPPTPQPAPPAPSVPTTSAPAPVSTPAPTPGAVTTAARRATAPQGARTEEMARLNQQADQELRNAGMDQLIQSLIAREAQQPSSLPAQGGIARIGAQYDAKGEAPLAGYVLPSQAAQATDYSPVEMILGNQRTMATAVQGPDGPVFRKNPVVGAPQLEGLEPAQVTKYVNDLMASGQMTPEMFKNLIEGGFARANNIETTSGGIAQQAVAGETQRAVAGTQAASAGNVANINLQGTKYTADANLSKPQVTQVEEIGPNGLPMKKSYRINPDGTFTLVGDAQSNGASGAPVKKVTLDQWNALRSAFKSQEAFDAFVAQNNVQKPVQR